jgi:hemolysin III
MYKGERFNSWSHLLGLCLALVSASFLLSRAISQQIDFWSIASYIVFACSMVMVYGASVMYHSSRGERKQRMEKYDHCAIYLLIAGTYTPLALIPLRQDWGWILAAAIWTLALFGIRRELRQSATAIPALRLYVTMGWLGLAAAIPIAQNLSLAGLAWLLGGALLYTAGIAFYVNDKRWLHAHGIWHSFVIAGTSCHFFMVWSFLPPLA